MPAAGTHPGRKYGGYDDPNPSRRQNYVPVKFTPRQNPFYCALPYNDKAREGHRPEAPKVSSLVQGGLPGSRCFRLQGSMGRDPQRQPDRLCPVGRCRAISNRSLGIRLRQRAAKTDLQPRCRARCFTRRARLSWLQDTDVTDWKFVEFSEVPPGPWAKLGNNNTFVINQRKADQQLVKAKEKSSFIFAR